MKRICTTTIAVIFQLVFCCAYCQPHNFEIKPGGPIQGNGTHKSPSAGYYYTEIDEENGTLTLYIPSLTGFVDVEISEEGNSIYDGQVYIDDTNHYIHLDFSDYEIGEYEVTIRMSGYFEAVYSVTVF